MRDRLKVTGFVLWLLATVILGTILIAWLSIPWRLAGYEFRIGPV